MKNNVFSIFLLLVSYFFVSINVLADDMSDEIIYWSKENKPIFYGATKIIMPTGTKFSTNDDRFRVFSSDFEDSDLSSEIKIFGEDSVNTKIEGNYEVTYVVTDSHGNESKIKLPIIVTNSISDIKVERTLYTIPSVWNMDLTATNRNNYGDRQILGIYLEAGEAFKIRFIDGERKLKLSFVGNNSLEESSIEVAPGSYEFIDVKNTKNYNSIPVITTPVMDKGIEVNKCSKLRFNIHLLSKKYHTIIRETTKRNLESHGKQQKKHMES